MRRLRLILYQFIREYKKQNGMNDMKYTLFEKYDTLEPEVISGIFNHTKFIKATLVIQSLFRMKLAKKIKHKLYKMKVENSTIKIQSIVRRFNAKKRFNWLSNRANKIIKATNRFVTMYWFSKYV